jgi:phasin family protein
MSQKPKAGMPARTASASKAAPKEVAVQAEPAAAESDGKVESDVKAESDVKPEADVADPVAAETVAVGPAVEVPPAIEPIPVPEVEATVLPSYSVDETISAASDLAAASAKAVSTTVTETADTVAAATSEVVDTVSSIEPTQPTMTQGIKSMMKTTEDFVAFGQANLEAFVRSGQIWSAGVQELTRQIASSAKASFDESVSTFKAMSTAKSVKEAIDLQSTFAKAALEKAMAESNKLTDASIKLTEQTLAPITARVTVAVETFGKAA